MTELTQFAHSSTDIAVLVAALADHDGLTRQKARAALVDIGHPAVPRLVAVLADTDRSPQSRRPSHGRRPKASSPRSHQPVGRKAERRPDG